METLKNRQLGRLHANFQSLSERIIQQYVLLEALMKDSGNKDVFASIKENEDLIDVFENEVRIEFINSLILFTPRAKDLRKIVVYQDLTNFLERIGDLLTLIAQHLSKIDFDLPELKKFLVILESMLSQSKDLVTKAIFSFYYEDKATVARILSKKGDTEKLCEQLEEMILVNYQDLPLTELELRSIISVNNIAHTITQVSNLGINSAESVVYFIDGVDIRHKKNDN
ncbi:hypothetical protein LJB98_03095 [Bacteroidales bacterium OttesenSCG-928-M11]|nr:hypothetical protein [Bacteroidales bacterium OttesenSCG-928-M11]